MKAFSLFMFMLLKLLRNKLVYKIYKTSCVIMCNNDKPYWQISSGSSLCLLNYKRITA